MSYPDVEPVAKVFRTAVGLWAIAIFAILVTIYVPSELASDEEARAEDGPLFALWVMFLIGCGFYMLRKYIWQPFTELFHAPLPAVETWRLVLAIFARAVPWGGVIATAFYIAMLFETHLIMILMLVAAFQLMDWIMNRSEREAEKVLHSMGLATHAENGSS